MSFKEFVGNIAGIWKQVSDFYSQHVLFLIVGSAFCLFIFTSVNSYLLSTVAEKRVLWENKTLSDEIPAKPKEQPKEDAAVEAAGKSAVSSVAAVQNGIRRNYDPASKVFTETHYQDGKREGLSKSFLKNGTVIEEMNWAGDKPDGAHTLYYRDGKHMQEASFKSGQREGLVKIFYENGKVMVEENYVNGERQYLKRYDPQGKMVFFEDYAKKEEPLPEEGK